MENEQLSLTQRKTRIQQLIKEHSYFEDALGLTFDGQLYLLSNFSLYKFYQFPALPLFIKKEEKENPQKLQKKIQEYLDSINRQKEICIDVVVNRYVDFLYIAYLNKKITPDDFFSKQLLDDAVNSAHKFGKTNKFCVRVKNFLSKENLQKKDIEKLKKSLKKIFQDEYVQPNMAEVYKNIQAMFEKFTLNQDTKDKVINNMAEAIVKLSMDKTLELALYTNRYFHILLPASLENYQKLIFPQIDNQGKWVKALSVGKSMLVSQTILIPLELNEKKFLSVFLEEMRDYVSQILKDIYKKENLLKKINTHIENDIQRFPDILNRLNHIVIKGISQESLTEKERNEWKEILLALNLSRGSMSAREFMEKFNEEINQLIRILKFYPSERLGSEIYGKMGGLLLYYPRLTEKYFKDMLDHFKLLEETIQELAKTVQPLILTDKSLYFSPEKKMQFDKLIQNHVPQQQLESATNILAISASMGATIPPVTTAISSSSFWTIATTTASVVVGIGTFLTVAYFAARAVEYCSKSAEEVKEKNFKK